MALTESRCLICGKLWSEVKYRDIAADEDGNGAWQCTEHRTDVTEKDNADG